MAEEYPHFRITKFAHCIRFALTIREAKPRKSKRESATKKQVQPGYIQLHLPLTD